MYGYKSCEKSNFTVFMLYGLLGYIRFFILVHVVQLLFKAILFLLGINLATEVQIAWRQTRLLSELDLIPKLLYFGFDVQEVPLTFFFFFSVIVFHLCLPLHFLLPTGTEAEVPEVPEYCERKAILVAFPAWLHAKNTRYLGRECIHRYMPSPMFRWISEHLGA